MDQEEGFPFPFFEFDQNLTNQTPAGFDQDDFANMAFLSSQMDIPLASGPSTKSVQSDELATFAISNDATPVFVATDGMTGDINGGGINDPVLSIPVDVFSTRAEWFVELLGNTQEPHPTNSEPDSSSLQIILYQPPSTSAAPEPTAIVSERRIVETITAQGSKRKRWHVSKNLH